MKKAFTMIELIVTIVILSILAAIAIPSLQNVIYKAKLKTTVLEACALQREATALAKFSNRTTLTGADFTTNDFDKITTGNQTAELLTAPWSYTSEHSITVYIQQSGRVTLDQAGEEEEITCAQEEETTTPITPTNLTITFDTQGGSAVSAQSIAPTDPVQTPTTPVRSGYNFLGWYLNPTGGQALTFPYTHLQNSNFTLYAQWFEQALPVTSTDGNTTISGPGTFEDTFNGITITRDSNGTRLQFSRANWEYIETTFTSIDTLYKTSGPNQVGPLLKNSNTDISVSIPYGNPFNLKIKYNGGSSGMNYIIG